MLNAIIRIVRAIKDSELAKIRITGANGELLQRDCIYKESEPPRFHLVFAPTALPKDLEVGQRCSVSFAGEEESITISASVEGVQGDRSLAMIAVDTIDPVSLREYFRVLVTTDIIASFEPEEAGSRMRPWTQRGQTVDLSGTGVLAVFPDEFLNMHNIYLDLALPNTDKHIECTAKVIRIKRLRKNRYQIALHFDDISRKNRDKIITACLQEQRRQLRMRMEEM